VKVKLGRIGDGMRCGVLLIRVLVLDDGLEGGGVLSSSAG
jgi:hypothetical protein